MADSTISRGVTPTRYYAEATFYRGIQHVYNSTKNEKYKSYLISQIDAILSQNGSFKAWDYNDHQLDNIRVGSVLLFMYGTTGEKKYRAAADFLRGQINVQKRTQSGGFWHKDPKYPSEMWLDGVFMAEPFYAQYTATFEPTNITAWDDIILQFDLIEKHCRDAVTGLLYHGYDESLKAVWANHTTGASPHFWDRAIGWYLMGLLDVLDYFPESHAGRSRLLTYATTLASALVRAQDSSGGWWLVMDSPYLGKKGNYIESSGSAMYTYGLLKGVRKGYLPQTPYIEVAKKAYGLLTEKFAKPSTNDMLNWEGTVRVGSLDQDATYEYYTSQPIVQNSLLGIGPFIYASSEFEALQDNKYCVNQFTEGAVASHAK